MDEKQYSQYYIAHSHACETISIIFLQYYKQECEESVRNKICHTYWNKHLDPDKEAICYKYGIKCTADGLHSIKRICDLEENIENIIPAYKYFRSFPIFFFPSERGGINPTRALVFGDRIDHTLFDLKLYFSSEQESCHLLKTYKRKKTKYWLDNMKSFENIIDWWNIKGIFTDENYMVYDLEYIDNTLIKKHLPAEKYKEQWSTNYYNNLKNKIHQYFKKRVSTTDSVIPTPFLIKSKLEALR